jgi:hypothetical protein
MTLVYKVSSDMMLNFVLLKGFVLFILVIHLYSLSNLSRDARTVDGCRKMNGVLRYCEGLK